MQNRIEQMAEHCFFFEGGHCCTDIHISKMCESEAKDCGLYQTLENLYKAGYRLASDVAREIFEEIQRRFKELYEEGKMAPFQCCVKAINETEKKYAEGGE